MEPADFYGIRGVSFTALSRQLGWLQDADALPHPEEEQLTRARRWRCSGPWAPGARSCASCCCSWPIAPITAFTRCPGRCRCSCASMAALVAKRAAPKCSPPTAAQKPAATDSWMGASSPTGQRTIHRAARGSRVLLFVREQRKQDGRPGAPTEPFVCLGFATYESHEGQRPMAIRWRLEREIPAAWLPGCCLA